MQGLSKCAIKADVKSGFCMPFIYAGLFILFYCNFFIRIKRKVGFGIVNFLYLFISKVAFDIPLGIKNNINKFKTYINPINIATNKAKIHKEA